MHQTEHKVTYVTQGHTSFSHPLKLISKLVSLGKPLSSNTPPVAHTSEATAIWHFTNMCIIIFSPRYSVPEGA